MAEAYPDSALTERFSQWASVRFEDVHAGILDLLPGPSSIVADIGAGSGRDADALAARGYRVIAVEPWHAMREHAASKAKHQSIFWIDDSLPNLSALVELAIAFDFILISAVWMHLNEAERLKAMSVLARLLKPTGVLVITVRSPPDFARGMHDVSDGDFCDVAKTSGFALVRSLALNDTLGREGVTWRVYCLSLNGPEVFV